MARTEQLQTIVEPIVASLGASIYDLDFAGDTFKLTIDQEGGVDLDTIAEVTRQLSRQLDLDDPIPGNYTLEVTSPGLERNLRTQTHWVGAVGELVRIKTLPNAPGDRRVEGVVESVDEDSVRVDTDGGLVRVAFADVEKARTVFVWGPQEKPGGAKPKPGGPAKGKKSPQTNPTTASVAATNESEST